MKKIYLFFMAMCIAVLSFGQTENVLVGSDVGYQPGKNTPLKSAKTKIPIPLKNAVSANQISVAILGSPNDRSWNDDVQTNLSATGLFTNVDLFYIPDGVPTYADIQNYDAILTFSDSDGSPFAASLGDLIAQFIDNGRGVVNAVFQTAGLPLGGDFVTKGYELIIPSGQLSGPASLGTVYDANHPIMNGVSSIGGNNYRSSNGILSTGSILVADWNDGQPLVVIKENVGPANAKRADLNLFPPSTNTGRSDFWDATTDGAILMSNALVWVSKTGCMEDILANNTPGQCGTIVNYTQPDAWAGAAVTQVDTSGLTSGDEFPVGVSTQSYKLDWGITGIDTCNFTVTVNDVEVPEILCKDISLRLKTGDSGKNVLLLWDVDNANTQSLKAAIETEGFTVTMPTVPEYQWDNTNPSLDSFDAVVHLNGTTYINPLSLSAQNALVDFVKIHGKTYIHGEWDAYEIDNIHLQDAMSEITILERYSEYTNDLTYNKIIGNENHPVLEGLPNAFTILDVGYSASNLRSFDTIPAEILMTDHLGTAGVAIRDFGDGKVVGFNHAGNYDNSNSLSDLNVQKLYTNALKWGTQRDTIIITPSMLLSSGIDNCGIQSMTISKDIFTISDLGPNNVTITVTDVNGNSSNCSSIVTLTIDKDIAKPIVKCNTIDIYLNENGRYVLEHEDIKALATGTTDDKTSFDDLIIKAFPLAYSCKDIGDNTKTEITVMDEAGNESYCWVEISVIDTFQPLTEPIEDVLVTVEAGECETQINYPEIPASSACNTVSQLVGLGADGMFPLGTTIETWISTNTVGDTTTLSFNVIVNALNSLPTIDSIADVMINANSDSVEVSLTGISPGMDCESQGLTLTAMGMDTTLINTINVYYTSPDSTGKITIFVAPDLSGRDTIMVYVTDSKGDSVVVSFVVNVNALPTIDPISDIEVDEDTPTTTVHLSGISSGSVAEEQAITVTATGVNGTLVSDIMENYISPDSTGSLELTIEPLMYGSDSITVTVEDSEGGKVSETFVVTVNHVNHAPVVVSPVPDAIINASHVLNIPVSAALGYLFDDLDGDELNLTASTEDGGELPAWITITGDTMVCEPMIADTGCITIVLVAMDLDGARAADTFEICVDGYATAVTDINASMFDVQMYPNPTKGEVTLKINTSEIMDSEVIVRTIIGSEVFRKEYKATEQIKINLSDNVTGIYLVSLQMGNKSIVKKLILDRN